jgi:hypothetical protein
LGKKEKCGKLMMNTKSWIERRQTSQKTKQDTHIHMNPYPSTSACLASFHSEDNSTGGSERSTPAIAWLLLLLELLLLAVLLPLL